MIRINKKTFPYKILLYFVILVESNFLGLISLPSVLNFYLYQNRSKWIAPIAVLMALYCWNNHKNKELRYYQGFIKKYLLILSLCVLFLYLDAIIRYPLNKLITTYGFGSYYLYSFLVIPLLYIFEVEGSEKFLNGLTTIVIFIYIIAIVNGISYSKNGSLLFTNIGDINWLRDGKVRISTGAFGALMLIYSIYRIYNTKEKKNCTKYYLQIILGIIYTLVIGQSRIYLLAVGFSIFVLIYLGDGKLLKKIIFACVVILGIGFLVYNKSISSLLNSFSANGNYGGSTVARLGAWKYYLEQFFHNPITAIGFAGDENYYRLVHGNSGIYYQTVWVDFYYEDCGIVGLMAQTGIFFIPMYLWPLFRYIRFSWKYVKMKNIVPGALVISITMYLLITTPTLIILSAGRVIAWPLIIAICELSWIRKDLEGIC